MPLSTEVLTFLQMIPRGKVMTYGSLAQHFSTHPRMIASILRRNREPDIFPCYRVVHSDGRIGGYNLGVEEKIARLQSDGIEVRDGGISTRYFWHEKTDTE